MSNHDDRFEPVPIPPRDGRHDIGDDVRAAIVQRLIDDWRFDRDLTTEKRRQLAMFAAASVRALLHELGTLKDLTSQPLESAPAPLKAMVELRDAMKARERDLFYSVYPRVPHHDANEASRAGALSELQEWRKGLDKIVELGEASSLPPSPKVEP